MSFVKCGFSDSIDVSLYAHKVDGVYALTAWDLLEVTRIYVRDVCADYAPEYVPGYIRVRELVLDHIKVEYERRSTFVPPTYCCVDQVSGCAIEAELLNGAWTSCGGVSLGLFDVYDDPFYQFLLAMSDPDDVGEFRTMRLSLRFEDFYVKI